MLKLPTKYLLLGFRTPKMLFGVLALALVLIAGLPVYGWADKGDLQAVASTETTQDTHAPLYVPFGKAELIDVDGEVSDVMVANPSIIDVKAIQSNRLYVVGLQVGDTNLIALDKSGNVVKKLDVHVKYDTDAMQALIKSVYPKEDITVGSIHDQILLTGSVSTAEVASKAAYIVGHYVSDLQNVKGSSDELVANLLTTRGQQQVMLQVKIVEADRSVVKELGLDTHLNDPNELSTTTLFGRAPPSSIADRGAAGDLATGTAAVLAKDASVIGHLMHDTGIEGIGELSVQLQALEEHNLVNVLAEPNLAAVSGEQAGFLAGGEFPVPVGRDQVGNVVVQFKQFGVSLNFRPTVLSDDRISLQLNTEVSSLDFTNTIPVADIPVPGLDVRRADTTVEVQSGGTLMIAGLLQSKAVKNLSKLPGIGDTPVIGELIKSRGFQRDETELIVFVTPYLVNPYAEKTRAEQVTKQASSPLADAYAQNIRRAFDIKDEDVFTADGHYGYILE